MNERGNHEPLKLFKRLQENLSDKELLETAIAQTIRILTVSQNNFSQLIDAHRLYPDAFDKVMGTIHGRIGVPEGLDGLLRLYLALRRANRNYWRLSEFLQRAREEAVKKSDWQTLERFANAGLTTEFTTETRR